MDWTNPGALGVKRLKYLGEAIIGLTYNPSELCDENEGYLVCRSSNIKEGKLFLGENVYVKSKVPQELLLRKGDILICSRNGSRDLIGKCAYVDIEREDLTFGAFTTVFRSKYNQFVFYFLNSSIFKAYSGTFLTSTINQLTTSNLNNFLIAVPPLPEQEAIAAYLDKVTEKIDQTIRHHQNQIEKLKEYKQSLINTAVTGKIKVVPDNIH